MKVLTIVGARPQFIKAAVVSRTIAEYNLNACEPIQEQIIHTGQHYDQNMSDIFFDEMQIPRPHYQLAVGSGSHALQTGQMLIKLEEAMMLENPDMVLIYGDTNSTLAGALAAAKLHIPVAHVEAGLRSFNHNMPEEINRILADRVSSLLLCPTVEAVKNLASEGIPCPRLKAKVVNTGDVMNDAAIFYAKLSNSSWLEQNKLLPHQYILATIHRAESTDNPENLKNLMAALDMISRKHYPIVWPMHPRTRNLISSNPELSKLLATSAFKAIEPIGYLDMVCAEKHARLIVTDSGGVQKEAFFHKVLCVTMRTETEWVELVEAGWNMIAGLEPEKIVAAVEQMLMIDPQKLPWPDLYGLGNAGQNIVKELIKWSREQAR
ncbi:MAG: UDP-N-acetylglucosamine 2-epimerase (non-hydrolyzing) [Candidatus Riflebacteria bacterium]|nr:UDP-N-acetylglucosamine 2-epimerase (non-hydrolyzing) [Candidatus Riflebacteria bacterium]